jgi:membrane-bound lytic murein transglycosylase F
MTLALHRGLLLCGLLLLSACSGPDSLSRVLERNELVVVSRNSPATFYEEKSAPAGFEYALAQLFAEELGVELKMEVRDNIADILQSVQRGQADFAAAGLVITDSRSAEFSFSPAYSEVRSQVIYVAGSARPRSTQDLLSGKLVVLANSSQAERLNTLQAEYPELEWLEIDNAEPADLLEMVNTGAASFTIIHSNEFTANQSFYP